MDDTAIEILETSLDDMLNKGECLVCFPDGREETVKLIFAFMQENYEHIVFPQINEKQQEVYKKCLYRRLKLTDNEEYRLAVARNALTHEDCGVRECSKDGLVEITELCESHNGVCKLINDIDKLSLDTRELSKSGVKVLDLGACDDLLNLQLFIDQSNKHDTVVILPSASNGYEKFYIGNCAVNGLSEIKVLPSKTTIGRKAGHYVRVASVTGLDSLSIRLEGSDYYAGDSHDISVYENDELKSLDIDYILPSYGTKFDLSVRHNDKLKKLSIRTLEFKLDIDSAFGFLPSLEEFNISVCSLYNIPALDLSNLESLKRFSFISEESGCINILVSNECEVVVNGASAKVFRYDRYIEGGKHEE